MKEPGKGFDPLAIMGVLNEYGVRYVVIGGIAAGVQGAIWATADLDIAYARDRADLDKLGAALAELEAVHIDLPDGVRVALDALALRRGTNWTLVTRFGRLDLLGEPGGELTYKLLAARARLIEGQQHYLVASVDDLIAMKSAAGRPKDLAQVGLLRTLAEELAIDEAHPDPRTITDLLDRIPGAWDSAMAGQEDIKAGRLKPLEDL